MEQKLDFSFVSRSSLYRILLLMIDQGHDYFRPLCPIHYKVMVICPNVGQVRVPDTSPGIDIQHCKCSVSACQQNYSPDLGYFTIERNDDYWLNPSFSSLRINRSPTQVICGEQHKYLMFIESFDLKRKVESFRCPVRECQQTMEILASGPPAYWLGEGFFRSR